MQKTIISLFLSLHVAACTGGEVRIDGTPAQSANVTIVACSEQDDYQLHTYATATDTGGLFWFNPLNETSAEVDEGKRIAFDSAIWLRVQTDDGRIFTSQEITHQPTTVCQTTYNNEPKSVPCALYAFDTWQDVPAGQLDYFKAAHYTLAPQRANDVDVLDWAAFVCQNRAVRGR